MWKKVKKTRVAGRDRRTAFGVRRNKTGVKSAFLLMPMGTTDKRAATIYADDKGNLAFEFADRGEFKVGKSGATQTVTIPLQFASSIPYGTRDCVVMWDAGLLVLDLTQFQLKAVAAE